MSDRAGAAGGSFGDGTDPPTELLRYRTLVDVVDDGLYQLDARGRFVAATDELVAVSGYSRDELLGEHVSRVLNEAGADRVETAIAERLDADDPEPFECALELQRADSAAVSITLRGNVLVDEDGFQGTVGLVREREDDRTGQDAVESALEDTDAIAGVFDEADVGIFVLDESFDVAWIDETVEEYFGIDREQVVGRDKRAVIAETVTDRLADPDAFSETVLATYDDNTYVEQFECRVTAGEDREERWLEHRSKPIESGPYAGGRVELYHDVTDQRRRAIQLRRLNAAVNEWLEESSREAVAQRASTHLRDILGMEINGVYLYDETAGELRPASWTSRAATLFDGLPTFGPGEGIAWRVYETGEPEVYADVTEAPDVYDPETPIRSEIALPIGDDGVALLGSEQRDAFDEGDLSLAKIVASSLEATFDRLDHERRLERERDLTDRILEATPVGAIVLDGDGAPVRINDRACEVLGVDGLEGADPPSWETYDEGGNRLPIDDHPFAVALRTGEPVYDRLLRIDRSDGDRRWLSVNAVPITDEDGQIDRVVTTGEDVTDLKERERELQTELREIFGRISDAFYAVDEELRFTHLNERAEELLGVDEAAVRGTRLEAAFRETPEIERARDRIETAMQTQETTQLEHESAMVDGWVEATIYPSDSGASVYFRDVSERKAMERELREEKEKFQQVAENLEQVLWLSGPDKEAMLYVNPAYEEVWGRDRESLYENPNAFLEAIHPADRERVREALPEQPRGEYDEEYRVVRPDGSVRWVRDRAVPIVDENGDVDRLVGVVDDVTGRRIAERDLRERERQLSTLMDNVPGMVYRCQNEPGWPVEFVSEGTAELTGYDPAALEAGELSFGEDVVVGADRDDLWDRIQNGAAEGEPFTVTYRIETAGGERRWVREYGRPVEEDGELVALEGVIFDVTERKRIEHQLRESEAKFRTLAEHLDEIVWMTTPDASEFLYVNPTYEEVWGQDREELYEDPTAFVDLIHPDDRERVLDAWESLPTDDYEVEYRIVRPDGAVRWIRAQATTVRDEDGDVSRIVGISEDVTERRERERRLEDLVQRLEASNERLEQFAYAASHDLQEPLRMVSSYLRLLEDRYEGELDEDGEEFLQFAVDGADRMREMIDGLLTYSRVETRGDAFEPVDLEAVLADVREDLQVTLEASNAQLAVGELPRVRGDERQLRQVFQNLLENAIEYSGDEPPDVTITADRREPPRGSRPVDGVPSACDRWVISVSDEGIGIAPEDQDRIFEVFERLHTHDEHPGTGIGLALCERIVERHGGDIWVDAEPGEGSTFSIALPAADSDPE